MVVLAALLASGCGGAARPRFRAASGWHVIAEPGRIISAANVPFAASDRSQSAPFHTVASLPKDGVLIWVQSIRRNEVPARRQRNYPRRSLPLRVEGMATVRPEGFTCSPARGSRCATRALQAGGAQWDVALWVFFGVAHPSRPTVAAANAQLARLSF